MGKLCLVAIVLSGSTTALADVSPRPRERADAAAADSSPTEPDVYDFLGAGIAVPGINILYWLPSFALGTDFAQINFNTMRGGINHGWVYDEDNFATNQIGHPYQGGNYFNGARAFGLSFWQSVPYVFGGSLMWEYLMESGPACCYPSINDLATTTVGGIAVGEVLWRLSNGIVDESATGSERFWREAAVLAVNPPYGLYRLSSGDAFESGLAPDGSLPLRGEVSNGVTLFGDRADVSRIAWVPRLRLRHGRIRELDKHIEPFDFFTLDLALGVARQGVVGATFDAKGLVEAVRFDLGQGNAAYLGLGIDFDYFENLLASLGQSAAGAVFYAEWGLPRGWSLFMNASALISFGSISSDYPDIREYNIGPGATAKLWLELDHEEFAKLYAKVDRYWISTTSGKNGNEFAGVLDVGGTYKLTRTIGLGLHVLYSDKIGIYDNFANTDQRIFFGEGYVSWLF